MRAITIGRFMTDELPKILKKATQSVEENAFSPFKIVGSAGIDAEGNAGGSGLCVGVTAQKFEILNLHTNEKRWLSFIGVGAGVSGGGPASSGSISTADFPSTGSRVVRGARQWTTNYDPGDLEGNTFIYTASAGAGGGAQSVSLLMFNYAVTEYYCYGIGVLEGKSIATPGYSMMNFIGITKYIWRFLSKENQNGIYDSSPPEPYFYNVSNVVGEQCPNNKDDVF